MFITIMYRGQYKYNNYCEILIIIKLFAFLCQELHIDIPYILLSPLTFAFQNVYDPSLIPLCEYNLQNKNIISNQCSFKSIIYK